MSKLESVGFWSLMLTTLAAGSPPDTQDSQASVSGTGVVLLERQPDILRVKVDVLAKAAKLEDALAQLKERREALNAQLSVLGASEASITFQSPRLTSGLSADQQQMQRMVMQKMRRGGGASALGETEPKAITVSSNLVAEWPLAATSPEQLLVTAHALQEKIKEADLGGKKALEAVTPEEEELLKEMEGMDYYQGPSEQPKPGEPTFVFARKLSDDERVKALAEAFAKAKSQAGKLATAAGAKLGSLRRIEAQASPTYQDPGELYRMSRTQYYRSFTPMMATEPDETGEATGAVATTVQYRIVVSAQFSLEK